MKIFSIYFYVFLWFKPRTLGQGHLDPETLRTYLFQASEPIDSEGGFSIFSLCSSILKRRGHFGHRDIHLNKFGKEPLDNAIY